jgi:hypothetical protein
VPTSGGCEAAAELEARFLSDYRASDPARKEVDRLLGHVQSPDRT